MIGFACLLNVMRVLPTARNQSTTNAIWVTTRFRSGTSTFTASHAEPLHHGHHVGHCRCPRTEIRTPISR